MFEDGPDPVWVKAEPPKTVKSKKPITVSQWHGDINPETSWSPWGDKKSALDMQVGGSHYKNFAIQPLEFSVRNKLSFPQGNVIKYVCRYSKMGKEKAIQDLEKAKHYIDVMIEDIVMETGRDDG